MANLSQKVQFKRGTKVNLELVLRDANKPLVGEPIWETDTNKMKVGDGINNYADLPYIGGGESQQQIIFGSRYEFPNIGEDNKLYIAKDEQNAYIWKGLHYEIVAFDNMVTEIDGGSASVIF